MPKNGVIECRQWTRGIMGEVIYIQMKKLRIKKNNNKKKNSPDSELNISRL